jgi:hypothetical protein
MNKPTTTIQFGKPATFSERMALRIIGTGVVLLTERPVYNFLQYFGTLWNVGCWTLAEYPVTTKERTS